MNRFIVPIVLTLIVAGLFLVALDNASILPAQSSAQAEAIDILFDIEFQLIAIFFALCMVFLFYSLYKFRRKPGDDGDGEHFEGHVMLEAAWTLLPAALVLVLGFHGATVLNDITAPHDDEVTITVTGLQWSWLFEYPDGFTTTNELYLQKDQPVRFRLKSMDVIHSFWVPEFRLKQDAVPGIETILRVTPNEVGDYRTICAELCGLSHARMVADVHVLDEAEYTEWLGEYVDLSAVESDEDTTTETTDGGGDDLAAAIQAGQTLYATKACIGCHSLDGTPMTGPTWLGVYGSEEALEDGSTVVVDDEYLYESIVDPNAKIVSGYAANIMPQNFGETLTEEEINNLIAFIASLSDSAD